MRLLKYLQNKVFKFQNGGDIDIDTDIPEKEQVLKGISKFNLYGATRAELLKFKELFTYLSRDPSWFLKLFKIKKVLPVSSVNGVIIIIETKTTKDIIDNQLLVKIPQKDTSDSITYEYHVGEMLNELRINESSNNFAVVYGMISCGFDTNVVKNFQKFYSLN